MSFSLCLRFFSFFFLVYSFVARCTFNPQFLLPWFLESSPPIIWQPASFANLEDSTHISYPACTSQQIPPFRIISSQEEVREEKCPGYITWCMLCRLCLVVITFWDTYSVVVCFGLPTYDQYFSCTSWMHYPCSLFCVLSTSHHRKIQLKCITIMTLYRSNANQPMINMQEPFLQTNHIKEQCVEAQLVYFSQWRWARGGDLLNDEPTPFDNVQRLGIPPSAKECKQLPHSHWIDVCTVSPILIVSWENGAEGIQISLLSSSSLPPWVSQACRVKGTCTVLMRGLRETGGARWRCCSQEGRNVWRKMWLRERMAWYVYGWFIQLGGMIVWCG